MPAPHPIGPSSSYPPSLQQVANTAAESSQASDNAGSEAKNDSTTETVQSDEEGEDPSSSVGRRDWTQKDIRH